MVVQLAVQLDVSTLKKVVFLGIRLFSLLLVLVLIFYMSVLKRFKLSTALLKNTCKIFLFDYYIRCTY